MKLICIKCPRGCELEVTGESITGNLCPRGIEYAKEEMTAPKRTVTALVKVENTVVPVKTNIEVRKNLINDILKEISKVHLNSAHIGDVIIKNVLDTGADIVVTGERYN